VALKLRQALSLAMESTASIFQAESFDAALAILNNFTKIVFCNFLRETLITFPAGMDCSDASSGLFFKYC